MKKGEIEIYTTSRGTDIQVKLENDSIWLDAHLIASLFDVNRPAIVKHIGNIFKSGELEQESTCSKMEQVAADGKVRVMNLYNLDIIISVGYRIGAFLFIWFLEKNKHRFKKSGELKINDNGLTAIALLVAQSKPEEKEIIIQLIVSIIADSQ